MEYYNRADRIFHDINIVNREQLTSQAFCVRPLWYGENPILYRYNSVRLKISDISHMHSTYTGTQL